MEYISSIENYLQELSAIIGRIDRKNIDAAMKHIVDTYENESIIYIFGNGGSAATASHLVCDYNKGISFNLNKKFNMISLCDNMATLMAYANDCGYENVFLYQLKGKLKKGDVVIGISGSGNSMNVVKAVEYAKECGNTVITMTGYSGGKLLKLSDCPIHIPINDMQKVEDCHMIIGHLIAQILAKKFGHPMC